MIRHFIFDRVEDGSTYQLGITTTRQAERVYWKMFPPSFRWWFEFGVHRSRRKNVETSIARPIHTRILELHVILSRALMLP